MKTPTLFRTALVGVTAALALGGAGVAPTAHAAEYLTGTCSGGAAPEHIITHEIGHTVRRVSSTANLLVPAPTGTSGIICVIEGQAFTPVPAGSTTGTFEVWNGSASGTTGSFKYYRLTVPA